MTDNEIVGYLKTDRYDRAMKGLYSALPAIKKYIKANNGTGEDAEDMFQDALVILYKKIHAGGFNLTVTLATYLQGIVKNLWFRELRKRKRLPLADVSTEPGEEIVAVDDQTGMADAAFNLLGEKCRQLLILFYHGQKSFREIAHQLSFSDEKVAKNQKYRCLQKAKENFSILKTNSHE